MTRNFIFVDIIYCQARIRAKIRGVLLIINYINKNETSRHFFFNYFFNKTLRPKEHLLI